MPGVEHHRKEDRTSLLLVPTEGLFKLFLLANEGPRASRHRLHFALFLGILAKGRLCRLHNTMHEALIMHIQVHSKVRQGEVPENGLEVLSADRVP